MGVTASVLSQSFPPKSKWAVDRDMPDLTGKVFIVTGGNTGVGKETVKALLKKNGKVYLAARNKDKADAAIIDIQKETGKDAVFLELDLGNLNAIKGSAEEFLSKEGVLHVLINNAGVMMPPVEMLTSDAYDLQFGTNVLGHACFTKLLMPALLEGAKASSDGTARVVNTSSSVQYFAPGIDWDTLTDTPKRKKMSPSQLYAQSKFGNVVYTKELARRYADQGIVATSMNPGNLKTDLQRHMAAPVRAFLNAFLLYPAAYGALTQLWAATAPEAKDANGKFFIPWARPGLANPATNNPETGTRLWTWIEEQVASH